MQTESPDSTRKSIDPPRKGPNGSRKRGLSWSRFPVLLWLKVRVEFQIQKLRLATSVIRTRPWLTGTTVVCVTMFITALALRPDGSVDRMDSGENQFQDFGEIELTTADRNATPTEPKPEDRDLESDNSPEIGDSLDKPFLGEFGTSGPLFAPAEDVAEMHDDSSEPETVSGLDADAETPGFDTRGAWLIGTIEELPKSTSARRTARPFDIVPRR